jgi:hypothetical protein
VTLVTFAHGPVVRHPEEPAMQLSIATYQPKFQSVPSVPAPSVSAMSVPAPIAQAVQPRPDVASQLAPTAVTPIAAAVEEASLGQQVLGKVGLTQQRYLQNQQLLSAITAAVGDRISQVGASAWALLRGKSVGDA